MKKILNLVLIMISLIATGVRAADVNWGSNITNTSAVYINVKSDGSVSTGVFSDSEVYSEAVNDSTARNQFSYNNGVLTLNSTAYNYVIRHEIPITITTGDKEVSIRSISSYANLVIKDSSKLLIGDTNGNFGSSDPMNTLTFSNSDVVFGYVDNGTINSTVTINKYENININNSKLYSSYSALLSGNKMNFSVNNSTVDIPDCSYMYYGAVEINNSTFNSAWMRVNGELTTSGAIMNVTDGIYLSSSDKSTVATSTINSSQIYGESEIDIKESDVTLNGNGFKDLVINIYDNSNVSGSYTNVDLKINYNNTTTITNFNGGNVYANNSSVNISPGSGFKINTIDANNSTLTILGNVGNVTDLKLSNSELKGNYAFNIQNVTSNNSNIDLKQFIISGIVDIDNSSVKSNDYVMTSSSSNINHDLSNTDFTVNSFINYANMVVNNCKINSNTIVVGLSSEFNYSNVYTKQYVGSMGKSKFVGTYLESHSTGADNVLSNLDLKNSYLKFINDSKEGMMYTTSNIDDSAFFVSNENDEQLTLQGNKYYLNNALTNTVIIRDKITVTFKVGDNASWNDGTDDDIVIELYAYDLLDEDSIPTDIIIDEGYTNGRWDKDIVISDLNNDYTYTYLVDKVTDTSDNSSDDDANTSIDDSTDNESGTVKGVEEIENPKTGVFNYLKIILFILLIGMSIIYIKTNKDSKFIKL